MLRNSASKRNVISISLVLLVLGAMTLALKPRAAKADERHGDFHVTKNCDTYTPANGTYCTILFSNLPEVKAGSRVYYDQATTAGPESGDIGLDTNAVLFVGTGDWAVGRCTLDSTGSYGVCSFSDGTGPLTGFHARVDVTPTNSGSPNNGNNFSWDGTYSFSREGDDR